MAEGQLVALASGIPDTLLLLVGSFFSAKLARRSGPPGAWNSEDADLSDDDIPGADAAEAENAANGHLNGHVPRDLNGEGEQDGEDEEEAKETDFLLSLPWRRPPPRGSLFWAKLAAYSLLVAVPAAGLAHQLAVGEASAIELVSGCLTIAASIVALTLSLLSHTRLRLYKRASPLLLLLPAVAAGHAIAAYLRPVSLTPAELGLLIAGLAAIVLCFGLELVPKEAPNPRLNPVQRANIFSQLTYSWLSPLLRLGSERALELSDLPPLRAKDTSSAAFDLFSAAWDSIPEGKRGLWRAYVKAFGLEFFLVGVIKLAQDLLGFAQPLLLSELIGFAASYATPQPLPPSRGILAACAMLCASLTQTSLLQTYFFRGISISQRIEAATVTAVYRKSLVAAKGEGGTAGEITNLQSVDADRISSTMPYLHVLWSGPLQILVALALLYRQLGPSMLVGLGVILLMIPVNTVIAKWDAKLEEDLMDRRDQRGKKTEELWRGVGIVRMYGWGTPFVRRIEEGRNGELKTLRKIWWLSAFSNLTWTCTPFFVSLATFACFTFVSSEPLTSKRIFVSISLFNMMTFPLVVFPMIINDLIQAIVSVRRVEAYLGCQELDPKSVTQLPSSSAKAVVISDATLSWVPPPAPPTLDSLSVELDRNSLAAITGRVGSGKSTLLSSLLGEVPLCSGSVAVSSPGGMAYVPQHPYIFSGTVKDNILFGLPFDADRYAAVLRACALEADLARLPSGDATELGARGVTVSGGQRARIALARAAYSYHHVALLDDPLAAVDARVARQLFELCIGPNGIMDGRTRLLVTHGTNVIPACSTIVALRGGKVVDAGEVEGVVREAEEEVTHESDSDEGTVGGDGVKKSTAKDLGNEGEPLPGGGQLTQAEESKKGSVGLATYLAYIRACGWPGVITFVVLAVFAQIAGVGRNLWLAHWAAQNDSRSGQPDAAIAFNLAVYACLGFGQTILVAGEEVASRVWCAVRASGILHSKMLRTVIRAPQWWFDATPLGRILNRFTSDVNTVDQKLVRTLSSLVTDVLFVLSVIIVDSAATPAVLLFVLPLGYIYYRIGAYYVSSSRELQRLQSVTKSPVYQHFSETLAGISTVRAFGQSPRFARESLRRIDDHLRARFARFSANRWLAVRLEGIGSLIVFGTALSSVLAIIRNPGGMSSSMVGLVISYALTLGDSLSWLVRESCDAESSIVSVERIEEFCNLPQEAPDHIEGNPLPPGWPAHGAVSWEGYSTRYREHLPMVLRDLNLSVAGGEKIGLVGRTGSGKSSLALSLFRVVEPAAGRITIDRVDAAGIGLADLRSNITVIPQDSVLFQGSVRSNLDPFGEHGDEALWGALEMAHLKELVSGMEGGLNAEVRENGENFSAGQRQMLSLARALLRRTKILILDEASANLDLDSDALVQATIKEAFAGSTIITIAHRLNTVLDYDRIVVLSNGQILEVGPPEKLLADRQSAFYALAKEAGLVGGRGGTGRETPISVGRSTPKPLPRES
ncbi:multi drug resistance-associated protein MRP [Hyaloraphidium curvatum]|nr:multi drug resistance-associated protein MRP [Hyaloraphidium curvatum]